MLGLLVCGLDGSNHPRARVELCALALPTIWTEIAVNWGKGGNLRALPTFVPSSSDEMPFTHSHEVAYQPFLVGITVLSNGKSSGHRKAKPTGFAFFMRVRPPILAEILPIITKHKILALPLL